MSGSHEWNTFFLGVVLKSSPWLALKKDSRAGDRVHALRISSNGFVDGDKACGTIGCGTNGCGTIGCGNI